MSEKSSTVDDIPIAGNAAFPVTTGNSTHGRPTAAENAAGPFLRRGTRRTARSALAAVAVMVMALAAFLGIAKPALAALGSGTGEQGANAGTTAARLLSAASAGHTISTATTLEAGDTATGGDGPVDFWYVPLSGGEQLSFAVRGSTANSYYFDMYAPGTTDASFPTATAFTSGSTNHQAESTITLQAPYNGTFILAVCENVSPCSVASKTGVMNPYTFTTSIANAIPLTTAEFETKAGATISAAPELPSGYFEAGGANVVDFWKVNLYKGYKFVFMVNSSTVNSYTFGLYAPGTTAATLPGARAVASGFTNYQANSTISLEVPSTGNFVLAVCENVNTCSLASKVMNPYTFTTGLVP
jgi:hypothetical protein